MSSPYFLQNVKAHPPLPAGAKANLGVKVVTTGCHLNRAAGSGWMSRLVRLSDSLASLDLEPHDEE
jgi:hypothetical protein